MNAAWISFLVPVLTGLLGFLLGAAGNARLRSLPAGPRCPACGTLTAAVVLPLWLRPLKPWLRARWCPRCGWRGLRKRLPPRIPGAPPLGHESGFRWSRPDRKSSPLFLWKEDRKRLRGSEAEPERDRNLSSPAHPSGFHWSDGSASSAPGFEWKGRRPELDGEEDADVSGPRPEG